MFRFGIRDLMWLTVIVAMGVAWWLDRSRLADNLEMRVRYSKYLEAAVNGMGDTEAVKAARIN